MKKIWKTGILCMTLLILLTGCVHGNLDVKMKADGTGQISASVSVRKDAYDQLVQKGKDPFQGKQTEITMRGSETYMTCNVQDGNLTYKEMETKLMELGRDEGRPLFRSVSLEKNGGLFYSSYVFKAETEAYPSDELPEGSVKLDIKVTMPAKVEKIQGGRIEGNTAAFVLEDLTAAKTLAAQSSANNVAFVLVSVAILAAVAATVLWIVKRKQG